MQDRQGTIMCVDCNEERDASGEEIPKIVEIQSQPQQGKAQSSTR